MKPKFSILTLLGITAIVAVNAAVAIYPASAWAAIYFYIWLGILVRRFFISRNKTSLSGRFADGRLQIEPQRAPWRFRGGLTSHKILYHRL